MDTNTGLSVLLVDDDDAYREFLAHALRRYVPQHTLETATSTDDAAARLSGGTQPDIVFIDLRPGAAQSQRLIESVRARRKAGLPLVVGMAGSIGPSQEYGCPDALLLKPMRSDDVSAILVVANAVRRAKARNTGA